MRHHKHTLPRFNRTASQRTALMRGLARSLFMEESFVTTVTKAKALRSYAERLITLAKADTVQSRRMIAARLGNATDVVEKLHKVIAPRYMKRSGGYTRVIRLGRIGKRAAESARIELVK